MKQAIVFTVLTLIVETAFGHVDVMSGSTDGNGRFEYFVVNHCHVSNEVILNSGENAGVYLAEGPANWSVEIRAEETVFFTDDPDAYILLGGSATFVLYSEYVHSTYQQYPFWRIDRLGRETIVDYIYVVAPAPEPPFIPAIIDLAPDTLNLKGKRKWIAAYIEPPEGYDVEDIEISTITLNKDDFELEAEFGEVQEGVLMVKFPCEQVKTILEAGQIELAVRGELTDGTFFKGTDTIKVIDKDAGP